jgi:hypothetical protein
MPENRISWKDKRKEQMMRRRPMMIVLLLILLVGMPLRTTQAATPGDGASITDSRPGSAVTPQSTINSMQIAFVAEYGKTSIFLRICADSPNFQMRSENVGKWMTEIFPRIAAANGCSPSTTSWWRMVYNIDPNTGETFRIYATANDTMLSEAAFMQRAARIECIVTGYAQGYCNSGQPYRPLPVSVPTATIDSPAPGATVSGVVQVSGMAVDLGSFNGPGVTAVQVYLNGVLQGSAIYGLARGDVAAAYGDSRFSASGFSFNLDTSGKTGPATIQVRIRSAISGQETVFDRAVTLNNTIPNVSPNTPLPISPASGTTLNNRVVTLSWQDTGDPDNGPRTYRDFNAIIRKADGSWQAVTGWQTATSWTVTLPSDGIYFWKAQSGDGAAVSPWSAERSLTIQTTTQTLDVRYVDQVYVQQVVESGYWNHCGPSSTAMVLHYEGKEPRDVLFDRQATLDLVCKVKPNCRGGANLGMILNTFRQRGLSATTKWAPSLNDLRASINAGHPVLIGIVQASHIVVAVGYQDGGKLIINDPFGGKNWWIDWNQRNDRKDGRWISRPAAPQLKGQQVPYVYGSELGVSYGVFISGPAPVLVVANAAISRTNGGTVQGAGTAVLFPSASSPTALDTGDTLSVTVTPLLLPSHAITEYVDSLAAFQLSALDANNQPVAQYDRQFTVTVELDPAIVDTWGLGGELTATQEVDSTDGDTETSSSGGLSARNLVMAGWNEAEQRWVPLPTTVNLSEYTVSATAGSFTEFAVLVKPLYTTGLPLIVR